MEMLRISIHPRDGKLNELLRICQYLTDETRRETGCKGSELMKDNEHVITLIQQWEQLAHMYDYFQSKHFTALLGAMKLLSQTYEIQINGSTHEEGRDIMKQARGI